MKILQIENSYSLSLIGGLPKVFSYTKICLEVNSEKFGNPALKFNSFAQHLNQNPCTNIVLNINWIDINACRTLNKVSIWFD